MEDLLRGITAASAAASNPLLRSLLGPSASAADFEAAAKEAEAVWAQLDSLADSDPEAYRAFIQQTATEARREAEAARDPHVEGTAPALVLEAQAAAAAAGAQGAAAGTPAAAVAVDLTRVVGAGQAVARVHIWAANDASSIKPPTLAGGAPLPAAAAAAAPVDLSGLVVPLAEYRPAATRPGPVPVHHFHIAAHVSAVRLLAAPACPPRLRAALLEGVSQFVEAEYRLALSRSVRTLQVHREALTEAELKELTDADEAARARQAASASAAAPASAPEPSGGAAETKLPPSLLQQLKSLGNPSPAASAPSHSGSQQPQQQGQAVVGGGAKSTKKPLIEELD